MKLSVLRRLGGEITPHRSAAAIAIAAAFVLAFSTALYPVGLELLTVKLMQADGFALSPRWMAWADRFDIDRQSMLTRVRVYLFPGFALLVLVKGMAQALHVYAWGLVTQRALAGIRSRLFGRMIAQSPGYFANRKTGDFVALFGRDFEEVERAVHHALPVLLFDSLKLAALALVALVQYAGLLTVAVAVLVAAAVPIVAFSRLLKRFARQSQTAHGAIMQRVVEAVGGISVVHANDAARGERERFDAAQGRFVSAMLNALRVRAIHSPVMEVLGVAATVATIQLAVGGANGIQPSEAVGFLLAMVLMYEPLKNLARLNSALIPGLTAAERIYALIDRPREVAEPSVPRRWPERPDHARFEDVWFAYEASEPPVLEGVSFELVSGRVTGLVGASGAGKSTISRLLPRLYDVSRGRILVGDIDVRELPISDLRSVIAVVSQDTFLFHNSVRDNITYGLEGVTDEMVVAAAERAQAHDFIRRLPQGYETMCGDRGVRLSGGQRQRIAIARAFVKDAPLLILDEPTSALDPKQERSVRSALATLVQNRAVLLIAHRGAILELCDEVLTLSAGRVSRGPQTTRTDATGVSSCG